MDKKLTDAIGALTRIRDMTDVDNPDSYRCDDREGCLDTVFAVASQTLKALTADSNGDGKHG
jgi:hypothetical protein